VDLNYFEPDFGSYRSAINLVSVDLDDLSVVVIGNSSESVEDSSNKLVEVRRDRRVGALDRLGAWHYENDRNSDWKPMWGCASDLGFPANGRSPDGER
jgi:hypothetical protein